MQRINLSEIEAQLPKRPQSLDDKLGVVDGKKQEVTLKRIEDSKEGLKEQISFFREYPDLMLDMLKDPDEKFEFYFFQRMFLRIITRHRYVYATFPRAWSKSFISVMSLYVRCMLYPNSKFFIVSGGKEQSAKIAREKIEELWKFFPALKNEVRLGQGQGNSSFQNDYIRLVFKNGSYFDVVAAKDSSRGGRRTGGLIEESAQVDGDILSQVIIPMMNVSRRAAFGDEDPNDMTNKSQVYITTAGDKGTFAYEKLIQFFLWSIERPEEAAVVGGTWRVPVAAGLLNSDFVKDLEDDGTYSEATFGKEYESHWGGGNDSSYFNMDIIQSSMTSMMPLWEADELKRGERIILSYDVGRHSDNSSLVVLKLVPDKHGTFTKEVANIYAFENMHFLDQAIEIKKQYMKYGAEKLVIDANGIGMGLVDFMTKETKDQRTGVTYPAFGIDGDSDPLGNQKGYTNMKGEYGKAMYLIKANAGLNSQMHTTLAAQFESGKMTLLSPPQEARIRLRRTNRWKTLTPERRVLEEQPFVQTELLRQEIANLRRAGTSGNVRLEQIASGIKKDKFSALEMGVWYAVKMERDSAMSRSLSPIDLAKLGGGSGNADANGGSNRFSRSSRFKRGGNNGRFKR